MCFFWILSGWKSGFMLAEMATITACILTFLDDPVPALKLFIRAVFTFIFCLYLCLWHLSPSDFFLGSDGGIGTLYFILFDALFAPALAWFGAAFNYEYCYGLKFTKSLFNGSQVAFFDMTIATIIGPIISVFMVHVVRSMSPDMTVQRMLALHYKKLRQAIHMPYGTGFQIHLRGVLDRIGVLNTKQVQSQVLKDEINNALIEASAMVDFTRLQELIDKLPPKSALKASLLELQRYLMNVWRSVKATRIIAL